MVDAAIAEVMRHAGRRKPESPCWTARRLSDSKHARAHTRARTHAHTGTESTHAYTQETHIDNCIQQKLPDAALNSHLKKIYISTDPDIRSNNKIAVERHLPRA